jgi:hypothetical protein
MDSGSPHIATFAHDKEHFIYCPEGEVVMVDVLAIFQDDTTCRDCDHAVPPAPPAPSHPDILGGRRWEWIVTGADGYQLTSEPLTSSKHKASIALTGAEAGDTITVTAIVSELVPGDCHVEQGRMGKHRGDHGDATATCTIKLWRMDMEVGETNEDPEEDPIPIDPMSPGGSTYQTQFAKSITTSAVLVGASPTDVPNWEWESVIDPPTIHATESGATSWGAEMVAPTSISLTALVENGCDSAHTETAVGHVVINPTIRRPGWKMENVPASPGTDVNWLSGDETAFPGIVPNGPVGQNTNTATKYRDLAVQVVTPIYVDLSITNPSAFPPAQWPNGVPNDYGDFSGKVKDIESGPNIGLFYNSSTSIYEVNRIALLNYWITPQGTWPSIVPNVNPNNGNAASYNRWLELYTAGQQNCQCSDPGAHGASGVSNIRHISNFWHEGSGCPGSVNQEKLGHQILIKKAIEGPQPELYDALWRCDLLYADSEAALRIADEAVRWSTSGLLTTATGTLHTYVSADPQKHNFYGFFWLYNSTSGWTQPIQNY